MKTGAYAPFYNYYYLMMDYTKELLHLAKNLRHSLNEEQFGNIKAPVSPIDEQQKIADFLDRECERIDGLKADIEAQIETLNEYKRSVITEAVTHGLDPNAPMKDSKVWYGQIPQGWTAIKGKYIFTQRNERGNRIELQLLSPTQKYGVIPQDLYEELSGMSAVKLNDNTNFAMLKTIHKGDYCISLRSFQGGFEYSEYEGVVSPAYQVFYPIVPTCSGYYKYLFKEAGFIDVMNKNYINFSLLIKFGLNFYFNEIFNLSASPTTPMLFSGWITM